MPRRSLTLIPRLTADELHDRYRASADPVMRNHYQILWRLSTGVCCPQVAAEIGYSAKGIRRLVGRSNAGWPDAVGNGRHANPGQSSLLDAAGDGGAAGRPRPLSLA